jgi:hypothetical protein
MRAFMKRMMMQADGVIVSRRSRATKASLRTHKHGTRASCVCVGRDGCAGEASSACAYSCSTFSHREKGCYHHASQPCRPSNTAAGLSPRAYSDHKNHIETAAHHSGGKTCLIRITSNSQCVAFVRAQHAAQRSRLDAATQSLEHRPLARFATSFKWPISMTRNHGGGHMIWRLRS